ncbi:MAG: AAA family ATPase [Gemmataceae bacterium]|nr:AAA family ATPase [Gemmataceae bacterium]
MDLAELIAALSQPAAYPFPAAEIVVYQTHISAVFLAGAFAYKLKKPVALSFLDFSTVEKRRHYCEEEVRLNRRLAPSVYLGVVPVALRNGAAAFEQEGDIVDWAVKMRRLPAEATLQRRLAEGTVTPELIDELARRLSRFHAAAARGPDIASFGRCAVVARNVRENFEQTQRHVGVTVSPGVHERLRRLSEEALVRLGPLIERRAEQGTTRDTHGDLHLDHVYWFPDRSPPDDLLMIDCIEFNERFRYADPVADMAFLVMDLKFQRRADLARRFAETYFAAAGDPAGRTLLPFYVAYRAIVRAKVEGLELTEPEIPEGERSAALARARGHWLLALAELAPPEQRPCLLLIGGLPGAGKSTLARTLVEHFGFRWLRSDAIRKELAGLPAEAAARADFEQALYAPARTEQTYSECLRRAQSALLEGGRVVVDASFRHERHRRAFLEAAGALCVPAALVLCEVDPDTARRRLAARQGDASDADWTIYQQLARTWEPLEPDTRAAATALSTADGLETTAARARDVLQMLGVC